MTTTAFTDREIFLIRQAMPITHYLGERQSILKIDDQPRYEGSCPFAPDDPRHHIAVLPLRGLWVCFGCNDGGDIFDLVRRLDGLDFQQAAAKLYRRLEGDL